MANETFIHDDELEKVVIGTLMVQKTALDEVRGIINEDCFYNSFHKEIYDAIIAIDKRGDEPDTITVLAEAKKKNPSITPFDIVQLSNHNTFVLKQHAMRLFDLSVRRELYKIGHFLLANSNSEVMDLDDVVSEATKSIGDLLSTNSSQIYTFTDALRGMYDIVSKNMSNTGLTGSPTGFKKLDNHGGGLQSSDLIIIAGESSQGKTSLAISICISACTNGAKVAFYSLEMEKEKLAARIVSCKSGVSSSRLLYSPLSTEEQSAMDVAVGDVADMQIFFDDRSTSSFENILSSIRSLKMKHNIDGAVIDYLQIVSINSGSNNSKEELLAEMARRLKNLAKDLKIWIIALSQLNRDLSNPIPTMGRLRGSGQIAEAADVVMLVYRPESFTPPGKYPEPFEYASTSGTAMIDVAKGRNIGIMKFLVGFHKPTTCFYDLDEIPKLPSITEEKPF